jgi:hypothetical protein
LLEDFEDPRVRPPERRDFLFNIMFTRPTRDIGYDWLDRNFDAMVADTGGIFSARKLPTLLGTFCSEEMAEEIGRKFRPRFATSSAVVELERVIEDVRNCGVLQKERGAEISQDFADLGV